MSLLYRLKFFLILFISFNMLVPNMVHADADELKCFTIGYADIERDIVKPYITALSEVYGNIGGCVNFEEYPYNRLMRMVSNDQIDALMGRSLPAIMNYPDLPFVPTPLINFKGYLVTTPEIAVDIRKDKALLAKYNFAGLYGSDWTMQSLAKMQQNFQYAENISQLADMFTRHHIDGFLASDGYMGEVMQNLVTQNAGGFQTVLLYDVPVYHILAPKNKALVEPLDKSVNTVKSYYGVGQTFQTTSLR